MRGYQHGRCRRSGLAERPEKRRRGKARRETLQIPHALSAWDVAGSDRYCASAAGAGSFTSIRSASPQSLSSE
jgi:hypothetical protein